MLEGGGIVAAKNLVLAVESAIVEVYAVVAVSPFDAVDQKLFCELFELCSKGLRNF